MEEEWEYACRGGPLADRLESAYHFYFDKPTNQLAPDQANFTPKAGTGLQRTCKVGNYKPNRLGLYDMHGNVWQWCAWEPAGEPKDAKAAMLRVVRGGSCVAGWDGTACCRAAFHLPPVPASHRDRDVGLRVARVPADKDSKEVTTTAAERLPQGSVWKGTRTYRKGAWAGGTVTYELYIRERDGTKFKGHKFDNGAGRNRLEVDGEIDRGAISWRERKGQDPNVIFRAQGTLQEDNITFTFEGDRRFTEGDGKLSREK
jgi:hypothetical protein